MKRRIVGVVSAGVVATALVIGPAGAAPPTGLATYAGGGTATALRIDAPPLELELTANDVIAEINSEPKAAADGTSLATPLFSTDAAPSMTPGGEPSNEVCSADVELPEPINALGLELACVRTTATVTDQSPAATAEGDEISLDIIGAGLLAEDLEPVLSPIEDAIDQILGGLEPVTDEIKNALAVDLETIIRDIIDEIQAGAVLARVEVGQTESAASATAETGVLASADAAAATITLLPDLLNDAGAPASLLTIVVGPSSVEVTRDAITGEPATTITPAIVDVTPGPALEGLNAILDPIEDGLEQLTSANALACNDANPLIDIVCIDAAAEEQLDAAGAAQYGFDYGAGTVGGRATAVGVRLLSVANAPTPQGATGQGFAQAAPQGAVNVTLSEAIAAANATPVQVPPPTTPPPPPETTLPRTGGSSGPGGDLPLAAVGAVAGLALAGLVLSRRVLAHG